MADKEMVAGSKKQLQQQKKDAKEAIDKSIDEALQAEASFDGVLHASWHARQLDRDEDRRLARAPK